MKPSTLRTAPRLRSDGTVDRVLTAFDLWSTASFRACSTGAPQSNCRHPAARHHALPAAAGRNSIRVAGGGRYGCDHAASLRRSRCGAGPLAPSPATTSSTPSAPGSCSTYAGTAAAAWSTSGRGSRVHAQAPGRATPGWRSTAPCGRTASGTSSWNGRSGKVRWTRRRRETTPTRQLATAWPHEAHAPRPRRAARCSCSLLRGSRVRARRPALGLVGRAGRGSTQRALGATVIGERTAGTMQYGEARRFVLPAPA